MKKNIFYMAALAVIAAACSNEDSLITNPANNGTDEVKMITETISATNGDEATRADVDADAKFTWSTGDQIAVHVSDGKYYTTEALAAGGSKSAEFTVTYPDGQARNAFAVYPASIVAADAANYGQSSTALDVTLPSSYTLAQVSGTTTPCPMIATNTPGSGWTFSQLCGLIRLTVKGIPADATSLKIQFPGKKVNGIFSIASLVTPGTSTISTVNTSTAGDDCITVTGLNGSATTYDINLPLPTGDYEDVYITPVGGSTKVAAIRHIKAGGYTAVRARAKRLMTTMVSFSVSASKKVIFSPGNLQATTSNLGADWTWHFAAHQYDRVGDAVANNAINGNGTVSENGTVDLFGFSTTNNFYGINNYTRSTIYSDSPYLGDFVDWGNNIIDGFKAGFWKTLNSSEGAYLLFTGGRPGKRFVKVQTSFSGETILYMLILPDVFVWDDSSMGEEPEADDFNMEGGSYTHATFTAKQFNSIEEAGGIFLPMYAYRWGSSYNSNVNSVGGRYWYNDGGGTILIFKNGSSNPNSYNDDGYGLAYANPVRLVHEL